MDMEAASPTTTASVNLDIQNQIVLKQIAVLLATVQEMDTANHQVLVSAMVSPELSIITFIWIHAKCQLNGQAKLALFQSLAIFRQEEMIPRV